MPSILGIDCGLTVTKAVVFDASGAVLAVARRRLPQLMPRPHHVERDMTALWAGTAEAIREALNTSGRPASDIAAVAATAHGDGLYLLDKSGKPLGSGILSLDSRAGDIARHWQESAVGVEALQLTGQVPVASASAPLLAWIKRHEPERYFQIGHAIACKDYLRCCLTGTIGTDRTEASVSFTNVQTQDYDDTILRLYDLAEMKQALPAISDSQAIVGRVTEAAAQQTGLVAGTPVAAGLHDVTASALGMGGHRPGTVAIVAGTYSINQVVSLKPQINSAWLCRNGLLPRQWNNMAISPASSANYDWFLDTLCKADQQAAAQVGASIHEIMATEIEAALKQPSTLLFHPYLFGSPFGPEASAAFFGLRGWHDRGMMLRAVLEGVIYNHRIHVDELHQRFGFSNAMLTGGPSRSTLFNQLFADVLNLPVTVTATEEAAAWGAALCAGAGVGLYHSPLDDPRDLAAISKTYEPREDRVPMHEERYQLFCDMAEAMKPFWPRLEALAGKG